MLENIEVLKHNSIRINKSKTIYIDPFKIDTKYSDEDIVFCTHSHYDHFSVEDILLVSRIDTYFVVTEDCKSSLQMLGIPDEQIITVKPNENYEVAGVEFITVPAYNINKKFHPKENAWVGYVIEIDGNKYYIAGDTDNVKEIRNIECDVAFIPVGGTYTMNYKEAAELANTINAKVVVPTHYGCIVGEKEDGEKFKELVEKDVEILIK